MISEKMQNALNEQIMKEFFSGYLYLSIEAYFRSNDLEGFANWFRIQAQEERDHAIKIFNYVDYVGGRIKLDKIDQPQHDFSSVKEALEKTLEHEKFVTQSIYNLVDLAKEEKDHKTDAFLQWFVSEQAEEENNAETNLKKLKMAGEHGSGLYMLDKEMGTRVYSPVPTSTGQGQG